MTGPMDCPMGRTQDPVVHQSLQLSSGIYVNLHAFVVFAHLSVCGGEDTAMQHFLKPVLI